MELELELGASPFLAVDTDGYTLLAWLGSYLSGCLGSWRLVSLPWVVGDGFFASNMRGGVTVLGYRHHRYTYSII